MARTSHAHRVSLRRPPGVSLHYKKEPRHGVPDPFRPHPRHCGAGGSFRLADRATAAAAAASTRSPGLRHPRTARACHRFSASTGRIAAHRRGAQPARLSPGPPYGRRAACSSDPAGRPPVAALPAALRNQLTQAIDRLGLDDGDLESVTVVRDYVSRSTGLRHVTFAQSFDGIPVFGGTVTVHIDSAGEIVRVTSTAARGRGPQAAIVGWRRRTPQRSRRAM